MLILFGSEKKCLNTRVNICWNPDVANINNQKGQRINHCEKNFGLKEFVS